MARAAAAGAAMNTYINLQDMTDDAEAAALLRRADAAVDRTDELATAVEAEVWRRLGRDGNLVVKDS
jgi:hypothetical protein